MASSYKTFYDLAKITIWSDAGGVGDNPARARLTLGFRDGNPRFIVFTGEKGATGAINFPMDYYTFGSVLAMLEHVIDCNPGEKFPIESLSPVYEDNKPVDKLRLNSTLYMGKTAEGVIYLSLIEEGKVKVVFPLKPTKWHTYRDSSKEALPVDFVSKKLARGLVLLLTNVAGNMAVKHADDEYNNSQRKPGVIKGFENANSGDGSSAPAKREVTSIDADAASILNDIDL